MEANYRAESYDYDLPPELIAQEPAHPRDSSRLLVLHRPREGSPGRWEHRRFSDLPEYLDRNDVLVVNETKVIRARLLGYRVSETGGRGGKVEFLLLEPVPGAANTWEGLFHAAAKHRPGVRFEVPDPAGGTPLRGELVRGASESPTGTVVAKFDRDPATSGLGRVPLPPYIRREIKAGETGWNPKEIAERRDEEADYQTVYAREPGSAAAPTAGFHFTAPLRERLVTQGVGWESLTLHVGLGTFRPVATADIRSHAMHQERFALTDATASALTSARRAGRRIVAVGTTVVRALESAWDERAGGLRAGAGRTDIFIHPGGRPIRAVDRLITNFHLPRSTLLMLVSAFAGRDLVLAAYVEAVRERYRFYSYGDAMLIL